MTCVKRTVTCIITTPAGDVAIGTNACEDPQTVCPRAHGEDYRKCKTICRQEGHAEIIALRNLEFAGKQARGARAVISGIDHVCRNCSKVLAASGVTEIIIRLGAHR